MYHCLKNHAARGVENVNERSFFGTTFKTVSTVSFLKFQNYCYLVAVMFSCFFSSTFNSKEIINASLQMHQKSFVFCFQKLLNVKEIFEILVLRNRILKSY